MVLETHGKEHHRGQNVITAWMLARAWGFLGLISAVLVMLGFFITLYRAPRSITPTSRPPP